MSPNERFDAPPPPPATRREIPTRLIASAVLAVLLVVFIVQNRREVRVTLLFVDTDMRVWTIIVISAALGALVALTAQWQRRRRR